MAVQAKAAMTKATPPSKKQTLLQFLSRGVAMVHLDTRRPGVMVPKQFEGEAHLRLNLSYRYSIPDLVVDEKRVQATLSFGGRPFQCQMPWEAVFGITSSASGDGQVWPEDLPTEVMQTLASREDADEVDPPLAPNATPPRGLRPALVPISGGEESRAQARAAGEDRSRPTEDDPPDAPPPRHLRLVR
jgi:stringent starvation protein B